MNKKILYICLILVFSAVVLTGCGTEKTDTIAEDKLAEISDDLDSALDEEINEEELEIDAVGEDEVENIGEMF